MAKVTPSDNDNVVQLDEEDLAALNAHTGSTFRPMGRFNLTISGVFVATMLVSRTMDGGVNWVPCGALGTPVLYSVPVSEQLEHSGEPGVAYRVEMVAFTSGSAHVRLSQ